MLHAGLGARLEHLVDHNAQTADRNKVSDAVINEADISCPFSPSDLQAMTAYVHTAERCCLYRAVVRFDIIRWLLYSLLTQCGALLVEMAV